MIVASRSSSASMRRQASVSISLRARGAVAAQGPCALAAASMARTASSAPPSAISAMISPRRRVFDGQGRAGVGRRPLACDEQGFRHAREDVFGR